MVTLVAKGQNGFTKTVPVSEMETWIRKAYRIGCDSVVVTGVVEKTVFFQ